MKKASHGSMKLAAAVLSALGLGVTAGLASCSSFASRMEKQANQDPAPAVPGDEVSAPTLGTLMRRQINPELTAISFQLFHNRRAPEDERFEQIAQSAHQLEAQSEETTHFEPPHFSDNMKDFMEYSVSLHHYASGIRQSCVERNMNEVVMWFWLAKSACHGCHEIYRFAEKQPLRGSEW